MPSNLLLCYILSPWLFLSYSGVFVTSITVIKCHGDGNLTKHFLGNCSLEVSQSITIMTGNMAAGKQTWYSDSSWELLRIHKHKAERELWWSQQSPQTKDLALALLGSVLLCSISWLCPYFLLYGSEDFPPLWFTRLIGFLTSRLCHKM